MQEIHVRSSDPSSQALVPSDGPKSALPGLRVGLRVHKLVSEKIAKNIPGTDSFYQFSLYHPLSKVHGDGPQDHGTYNSGAQHRNPSMTRVGTRNQASIPEKIENEWIHLTENSCKPLLGLHI